MNGDVEERLPALDGLRGFAALYVVVCHYQPHPVDPVGAAEKLLAVVVDMGWCGVDLFFVLSGFLITGILLKSRGSGRYFSSFYARRVLRIFPLYYGLCAAVLVVLPLLFPFANARFASQADGQTVWYWFFLQNLVGLLDIKESRPLSVTWSLAIEEQFYLVWPFLIWALGGARSLYAISTVFVGQFVARILLYVHGSSPAVLYSWPFTHLDGIALGSILAIAWSDRRRYGGLLRAFRLQTWIAAPMLVVVTGVASLNPVAWDMAYHPMMVTVGYTLCSLVFAGLLLNCLERNNPVTRVFMSRPLRSCGRYSYAMYLLHFPVLSVSAAAAGRLVPEGWASGEAVRLAVVPVALFATYALSALSWHLLEKRVLALKRFFPYTEGSGARPLPAALPEGHRPAA